jgi:SsrA-binding protein
VVKSKELRKAAAAKAGDRSGGRRVVATNRKARHDYTVLDIYEAGVVLQGTEVKALREGQASLADAFATVDDGEIWLRNLHIPEYHLGTWTNHAPRKDPRRQPDPGAAVAVLLRRPGEGRAGAGPRQAGAR